MGDGAVNIFATLGRLTGEAMKEKTALQSDLEEALKIIGCLATHLDSQFSKEELSNRISERTKIPIDKVSDIINKGQKLYKK